MNKQFKQLEYYIAEQINKLSKFVSCIDLPAVALRFHGGNRYDEYIQNSGLIRPRINGNGSKSYRHFKDKCNNTCTTYDIICSQEDIDIILQNGEFYHGEFIAKNDKIIKGSDKFNYLTNTRRFQNLSEVEKIIAQQHYKMDLPWDTNNVKIMEYGRVNSYYASIENKISHKRDNIWINKYGSCESVDLNSSIHQLCKLLYSYEGHLKILQIAVASKDINIIQEYKNKELRDKLVSHFNEQPKEFQDILQSDNIKEYLYDNYGIEKHITKQIGMRLFFSTPRKRNILLKKGCNGIEQSHPDIFKKIQYIFNLAKNWNLPLIFGHTNFYFQLETLIIKSIYLEANKMSYEAHPMLWIHDGIDTNKAGLKYVIKAFKNFEKMFNISLSYSIDSISNTSNTSNTPSLILSSPLISTPDISISSPLISQENLDSKPISLSSLEHNLARTTNRKHIIAEIEKKNTENMVGVMGVFANL
jgi:hypothetical protein